MGQSTDALIAFGVDHGEDANFPWGDDIEVWWAKRNGIEEPTSPYEENKEAYRVYWREKHESMKTCPVELVRHCSQECPMWILAVPGTLRRANRGYPQNIGSSHMVDEDKRVAFVRFCNEHKISLEGIGWLLFSDWS